MQRVAAEPTLAGAAIRYANLGIPVFPCVTRRQAAAHAQRLPRRDVLGSRRL